MSYYISKLECKNIGLFDDLKIEFSERCNIIIGPNGCGKTSILKLICMALFQNEMKKIRFRAGASLVMHAFEAGTPNLYGGTNISDQDQQINTFNWGNQIVQLRPELNEQHFNLGSNSTNYKLFAIGAQRHFSYKKINGMNREEKGERRLKSYLQNNINYLDNHPLPDIKQWMINRYFVIEKEWAKVEKDNWLFMLDYIPKLSPDKTVIKFVRIQRELEPIFEINGRECFLDELSSGFKSILSIIFSIVDWIEGVNEGDSSRIKTATGTVLIDEIDVHLHPQWQQNILGLLKTLFENLQFIVTAHSPLVVSAAAENEVIVIPDNSGILSLKPQERFFRAWMSEDIMAHLMGFNNYNDGSEQVNKLIDALEQAIKNGDIKYFDQSYSELKELLGPDDPIRLTYSLRRSEIFYNNNDQNFTY
jgi:AAA15 family ATPase/GTPase